MNLHHQPSTNGTGQPCRRALATFVCEGSVVAPHRPLYFTPEQARKGLSAPVPVRVGEQGPRCPACLRLGDSRSFRSVTRRTVALPPSRGRCM